jgi:lysozyme
MFKGVDISVHNGSVDFNRVRNAGIDCVIMKATEGVDFVDSYYEEHYAGANGKFPYLGTYHFFSEKTDPVQQANDYFAQIQGRNFNVRPILDIETNNYGRSASAVTDRALAFLHQIEALTGVKPIVYTYVSFANENLDGRLAEYPLWIAHYGVNTPAPTNVWGGNYVGHQYAENGSVDGIFSDCCDMNNFTEGIAVNGGYTVNPVPDQPQAPVENEVLQLQRLLNAQGFGPVAEDGIAGPETLSHCPLVRKGASGEITTWIQLRVGADPDGDFGPATEQAVIWFQQSRGLSADGVVGQNTWRQLLNM